MNITQNSLQGYVINDDDNSIDQTQSLVKTTSQFNQHNSGLEKVLHDNLNKSHESPRISQTMQQQNIYINQQQQQEINLKILNGGYHPDRQVINLSEIIVDPNQDELNQISSPLNYFSLYQSKLKQLANEKFHREKDHMFYEYLDRYMDKDKFKVQDKVNGITLLNQFVSGNDSLTQLKKENERKRRWEYYRQQRIQQGLPPDPSPTDYDALSQFIASYQMKRAVSIKQKAFNPDLQIQDSSETKNFISSHKFGTNRNFKAVWTDPNPVKYGGKYGMQHLKEMIDTGFQRGRNEMQEREERIRLSKMTDAEILNEQLQREEDELKEEESRQKLADLSETKFLNLYEILQPNERSFLIQPQRPSLNARLPQLSLNGSKSKRGSLSKQNINSQALLQTSTNNQTLPDDNNSLIKDISSVQFNRFNDQKSGLASELALNNNGLGGSTIKKMKKQFNDITQSTQKLLNSNRNTDANKIQISGIKAPSGLFGRRSQSMAPASFLPPINKKQTEQSNKYDFTRIGSIVPSTHTINKLGVSFKELASQIY